MRGPEALLVILACAGLVLASALACSPAQDPPPSEGAARQARDPMPPREAGPRVAHVVVALCDNVHQGIVPVPAALGDGDDLRGNLYWGARYGVKTFLSRSAGWTVSATEENPAPGILERVIFRTEIAGSGGGKEEVFLVADAWRGRRIRGAVESFLEMSAGRRVERVSISSGKKQFTLVAGGGAQVVAYVGHDGLMDFSLSSPAAEKGAAPRGAIVLACASKAFFGEHLRQAGAGPLLLTTGLMAPEAYTLDAALRAFFEEGSPEAVREAAAAAYDRYQNCGLAAARRLFWASP